LHRGLKQANVMLDGRCQVRLTDFGLAVAAEGPAVPDVRSGTPLYHAVAWVAGG
jgi:serine/threonine protein kinase